MTGRRVSNLLSWRGRLALGLTLPAACSAVFALPPSYGLLSVNTIRADDAWQASGLAAGGGLRLGLPLSEQIDLQIGLHEHRSRGDTPAVGDYRQSALSADMLWGPRVSAVRPFGLLGVGVARDRSTLATGSGDTAPTLAAGAGLQWRLSPRWLAQLDARYQHSFLRSGAWPHGSAGNAVVNVALGYAFGPMPAWGRGEPSLARPAAPPAVPPAPAPVQPTVQETQATEAAPPPQPLQPPQPNFKVLRLEIPSPSFAFDSAALNLQGPELEAVRRVIARPQNVLRVVLEGHADEIGSDRRNVEISQARAMSLKRYLVAHGVDPARIQVHARGSTRPKVECPAAAPRAERIRCLTPNRRTEIALAYTE